MKRGASRCPLSQYSVCRFRVKHGAQRARGDANIPVVAGRGQGAQLAPDQCKGVGIATEEQVEGSDSVRPRDAGLRRSLRDHEGRSRWLTGGSCGRIEGKGLDLCDDFGHPSTTRRPHWPLHLSTPRRGPRAYSNQLNSHLTRDVCKGRLLHNIVPWAPQPDLFTYVALCFKPVALPRAHPDGFLF